MGDLEKLEPGRRRVLLLDGHISIKLAQAQLDKILASREFAHSERLRRFLRYTVEQLIQGQPERMKEYHLGLEVFGRDPSYDPRLDPIVRVEAHRLRSKLKHYYRTEGRKDHVIIELPKGTYVPVLRERRSASRKVEPIRPQPHAGSGQRIIAVLPFVILTAAKRTQFFAGCLAEDLMDSLAKISGLRVISRTSALQFKGKAHDVRRVGKRLGADAVVEGSVRKQGSRFRAHARLIDVADGCCLWSRSYNRTVKDLRAIEGDISRGIHRAIRASAQPRTNVA